MAILDRFHPAGAARDAGTERYTYSEGGVTAEMVTGAGGRPELTAKVRTGVHSYLATYTDYSRTVDSCAAKLFYKYKDFTCKDISVTDMAQSKYMGITDWLVLEYPSQSESFFV